MGFAHFINVPAPPRIWCENRVHSLKISPETPARFLAALMGRVINAGGTLGVRFCFLKFHSIQLGSEIAAGQGKLYLYVV